MNRKRNDLKEHKQIFLNAGGPQMTCRKPLLRQFSPLMVAMVGLPGRGKSILAKRLERYMNYTGDTTKGEWDVRIVLDTNFETRIDCYETSVATTGSYSMIYR